MLKREATPAECDGLSSGWRRLFGRLARTEFVTARTFAFIVWLTCAVATLPAAARPPSGAPLAYVPSETSGYAMGCPAGGGHTLSQEDPAVVSDCWGAARLNVSQAWRLAVAPQSTLVAVLDTGIDTDGTVLDGRVIAAVNLVEGTDATDVYGHGTHVAATIATIAPNSTMLNIKVADDRGFCTNRSVAEGIRLAASWGADVINLSLQVEPSPELEAATMYAWEHGAVIVAAAGTPDPSKLTPMGEDDAPPNYPAAYPRVIAVAGTNEDDTLAPLSQRASWIDVAAPGRQTTARVSGDGFSYLTGTSTAAAHVSGVAALLCGIATDRNRNGRVNDEVRCALEWTAEPLDDLGMGWGMVNATAAVAFILG